MLTATYRGYVQCLARLNYGVWIDPNMIVYHATELKKNNEMRSAWLIYLDMLADAVFVVEHLVK